MKDTVINGTRNSRSVYGSTTIPLSWEEARAQLISSGWPIDLGGPNAEGCSQIGTAINKANLLKDTTAALFGLTGTAVPDEVLAKINQLISQVQNATAAKATIIRGTYTGAEQISKVLNFPFNPIVVFIGEGGNAISYAASSALINGAKSAVRCAPGTSSYGNTLTWGEKSVTIEGTGSGSAQKISAFNFKYTYTYIAIG